MYSKYLDIKPEVAKALEEGTPVVALESTVISLVCRIRRMWRLRSQSKMCCGRLA